MKTIIFALILFSIIESNYAQTPEFETTFYFEDALGNKDSVVVGYDPSVPGYTSGKPNGFDPQFGEKPKQVPFDTILDVRIDPDGSGWEPLFFYKRMIGFCEKLPPYKECYGGGTAGAFVISNKYPPLKISYSQKAFGNPKHTGSFLTFSKKYYTIGPWAVKYYEYYCLSDVGEHLIDFRDSLYLYTGPPLKKYDVPMMGDYLANLPQLNFNIGGGECMFHTAAKDVKFKTLQAYPVPTQDRINIDLPGNANVGNSNIVVYDLLGRPQKILVLQSDKKAIQLDVSNYGPGYYLGVVENAYLFKFVKN